MTRLPRAVLLTTATVATTATVLLLSACGGGSGPTEGADGAGSPTTATDPTAGAATDPDGAADPDAGTDAATDPAVQVVAAFYPLEFLATRVGGDRAAVTGLTPPGAEPHDLELSPQSLAGLGEADLLVVLGGFQPSLDDALGTTNAPVLDLAAVADRPYAEGADEHADDDHAEDEHAGESPQEHAEHGDTDPHFWTDPSHMAEAAEQVAAALTEVDPEGAEVYAANLETLTGELDELDAEAQEQLGSCDVDTLVTAHDAFGYFADRYGFEVRAINGISPDQDPDARTLAELSDFVAAEEIDTVYTETLVSSRIADTVAAEAGVRTAVLDPVEGLTDASSGGDYLEVMRANIDAVRTGQACS